MSTTLLNINVKETGKPWLRVLLEDVPGIDSVQTDVTIRLDHSRLQNSIDDEKWLILSAMRDQIDLVVRSHYRQHEQGHEQDT